ncbi:MAG: 50S ribosomal protein L10 [Candidatus Gottesmanbacteria bacterium]|nr:50S ribosomal protein L10 [Candidatus Gottesmanbacteria bacterium]
MATQKKIDTVTLLNDKISRAKSMVFVDYRGLKHKQMEELRRTLKKHQGELTVAKNRLLLRSLSDKAESLKSVLSDTTATLFAYADEVAPLKELLKFLKVAGFGKTKGGLLGNAVLTDAEVTRLAVLPTRDVLLGRLVGQLNAPIQGLHYALSWNINKFVWALNAIQSKKN